MEAWMHRLRRMKRVRQGGLFDLPEHLKKISERGDPLEALGRALDFEVFRPVLEDALGYSDGSKGGRPPYDPVAMFKILLLQAQRGRVRSVRNAPNQKPRAAKCDSKGICCRLCLGKMTL